MSAAASTDTVVISPDIPAHGVELETKLAYSKRPIEVKEGVRNGIPVGIVAGYIATWDVDSGGAFGMPDKFQPGTWAESLQEHRVRGMRQVRLKDHHGRTVGGFPIDTVVEDEFGLFGIGEINLQTQQGAEAYSLARQEVLTDFSVGFTTIDFTIEDGVRVISKAKLWEGSVVDEPANQNARILEVKRLEAKQARVIEAPDLERLLIETGRFSKKAAKVVCSRLRPIETKEPELTTPPDLCYDSAELKKIATDLVAATRAAS